MQSFGLVDCIPDTAGSRCINCGWQWKRDTPFPRRNCPKAPSLGLGDTVAKIIRAVGIKPCGGCKKRQAKLNKWFPYGKKS